MSTSAAPPRPTRPAEHPSPRPGRRRHRRLGRVVVWVLGVTGVLVAAIGVGLRIQPAPLAAPELVEGPVAVMPLPEGLPAPVERFYRALYGDEVPVVETAVISGRGTMRIQGVTLPSRYRFSHVAGSDYRHYIETTAFGARLLTVDEWYLDGVGRLELPFGISEGPEVDQGANLALWAELVWAPSVWVTDPAARWQPIDDTSARLVVPFGEASEVFTVTFDGATGLLERMESLRYKGEQATEKTRWVNEAREWGQVDGHPVPLVTAVGWGDEASPWAVLRTEGVLYNADLSAYVRAAGP